jgi:Pyruvate/2-oxoacid:ferredoxin oxidoreductase delta subunit
VVAADTVLSALGGEPGYGFLPPDMHRRDYTICCDEWGRTKKAGLFAGGDVAGEPRTVAHALGAGKRVAIAIDHWLRKRAGENPPEPDAKTLRYGGTGNVSITRWRGDDPVLRTNELNEVVPREMMNFAYFTHEPGRHDRWSAPGNGSAAIVEANLGLAPEEALAEAKRCLNCGVCNDCEVCLIVCPDVAIHRHSEHGFSLSYKYCKGCGLCVQECPRGAMTMTREGL